MRSWKKLGRVRSQMFHPTHNDGDVKFGMLSITFTLNIVEHFIMKSIKLYSSKIQNDLLCDRFHMGMGMNDSFFCSEIT